MKKQASHLRVWTTLAALGLAGAAARMRREQPDQSVRQCPRNQRRGNQTIAGGRIRRREGSRRRSRGRLGRPHSPSVQSSRPCAGPQRSSMTSRPRRPRVIRHENEPCVASPGRRHGRPRSELSPDR